jgi:hypothetical protein
MLSKNCTDDGIANLLFKEENNSEDDLWSEYEDKEITDSDHEDGSNYEGEEEEGDGGSNSEDSSDVTGSGGNEMIIKGTNGYERSVNEAKRIGQPPRRIFAVIQLVLCVKLETARHQLKHGIYYLKTLFCRKFFVT